MRSLSIALLLAPIPLAAQNPAAVAEQVTGIASMVGGEGPIWAQDGSRIYFASPQGGLWSISGAGGGPTRLVRDLPAGLIRMAPGGERFAYLSEASGNPEIWLWDPSQAAGRRLTNFGGRINAMSWSPDGRTIAFSAVRYGQFDVWTVEVGSGTVARITDDPRYETYPTFTPDGRSILFVRSDDRWADHDIMAVGVAGGTPRLLAADKDLFDYGTIGTRAKMSYPLISPDGKSVLFKSHRSGWINYWVVGIDGGAVRPLAAEPADQSDARWSPDGKSVAFASMRNGTQQIEVATVGGPVRAVTSHSMGVANSPEWSPTGDRIAYYLGTPTRPQDLHVVAATGGSATALTSSIDLSVERSLIVPEKVSYRSGPYTISGYLFRPPPGTGDRHPGVMYIHGGPTAQFADTYLPQAQFLARMGYLVLAPNIRGSSGYGKVFEDANNPCWTHCDLEDVVAGVGYLKGLSNIDRDRIGITGNSYGGIMSMGAVAHAPGVFQAAVPQSGYANWISFQDYNTELQHSKLNAYEWGPYPDSAEVYRRNSSIFSASKVTTPVFLIQGDGTTQPWRPGVYPITASLEFAHALDRYNKVVKFKSYPGDSYYVTSRENSRQVLIDMVEFFDQYLKDGAGTVRASAASGERP